MKTITIPETRLKVLFEMLTAQPPRLLQDDQVKGFLLSPEQYEAVIELLEDIEDLQDALQSNSPLWKPPTALATDSLQPAM